MRRFQSDLAGCLPAVFVASPCHAAACAAALSVAAPASAEIALQARVGAGGTSGDYTVGGLSLRLPALWMREPGNWRVTFSPEIELARFRYRGEASGGREANEIGALGLFRFTRTGDGWRPYAELGLGGALFGRDDLGGKRFSTSFQFSEHVGLGVRFAGGWLVGWRYSHYSNANIRLPNPGLDLQQLTVGVEF